MLDRNYELARIYIGMTEGGLKFLYSLQNGLYEQIPETQADQESPYGISIYKKEEVRIVCSLKEYVKREGFTPLLLTSTHQYLNTITRYEIELVKLAVANKKKYDSSLWKIQELARFTSYIVCDELGLNVALRTRSNIIDPNKVSNVAVFGLQISHFADALTQYIFTYLLTQEKIAIRQKGVDRSDCISSCLRDAHIKDTEELLQNEVYVSPDLHSGNVSVKNNKLKSQYIQEEQEYQKIYVLDAQK